MLLRVVVVLCLEHFLCYIERSCFFLHIVFLFLITNKCIVYITRQSPFTNHIGKNIFHYHFELLNTDCPIFSEISVSNCLMSQEFTCMTKLSLGVCK